VVDVEREASRVGELLQLDLPQPHARAVRAAAIAVIVSSFALGQRSRPMRSSQQRIAATANSA
jgi:hypothetical protein